MPAPVVSPSARPTPPAEAARGYLYLRHRWPVRLTHWINALALLLLLMSGLSIFNAHPSLDWGRSSYTGRPSFLAIGSRTDAEGRTTGYLRVDGHEIDTTGWLGVAFDEDGDAVERAFPRWMTVPGYYSLGEARQWHFFFAWLLVVNGALYVAHGLASHHLRRDLLPTREDWRGVGHSILDHVRLRHPQGEAARHYNILQKLAYLAILFGVLPAIVLAGWAMSPWLNSLLPGWVDLFGGRQSARSVHFICAWLLVAFVAIHVFEVLISGVWNHLRSMATGYYRIDPAGPSEGPGAGSGANG